MEETAILIAEDNPQFLNSLYNYLKNLTKNIITVKNGKQVLEKIKNISPSILLLDLQMPEINGIEVLQEIKNMNIKVIIISGERMLLNQIPITSYDFIKSVLVKPVDLEIIYSHVHYLLLEDEFFNNMIKLQAILNEFAFNRTSRGFYYLFECLTEIIRTPACLKNIEKSVYPIIAHKHNYNNINKIKWCITKTIKSMVRFTDDKVLKKYFLHNSNITPKYFMIHIYSIINKTDKI